MGSVERIKNVARRVAKWHAAGHQVVVVPSAMSGETNRLLGLAREISESADGRELDMIAATGEQASSGLLAIALQAAGLQARRSWSRPKKSVRQPETAGGSDSGGRVAVRAGSGWTGSIDSRWSATE